MMGLSGGNEMCDTQTDRQAVSHGNAVAYTRRAGKNQENQNTKPRSP